MKPKAMPPTLFPDWLEIPEDVDKTKLGWKALELGSSMDNKPPGGGILPKQLGRFKARIWSGHGRTYWPLGKWLTVKGTVKPCSVGFHCSSTPLHAFRYVHGYVFALVEYRGDVVYHRAEESHRVDKLASQEMRIVRAWLLTNEFFEHARAGTTPPGFYYDWSTAGHGTSTKGVRVTNALLFKMLKDLKEIKA